MRDAEIGNIYGDGRDELHVASDDQKEVRRYNWSKEGWKHKVLLKYEVKLSRFTWNIMAVPTALLPNVGVEMAGPGLAASKQDQAEKAPDE